MKKKLPIILTSALFVLTVAGCNQKSNPQQEPQPEPQPVVPDDPKPQPDPEPQPQEDPVYSKGTLVEKKFKVFNLSKVHTLPVAEQEVVAKYDIGERSFYYVDGYQYDYYLTLDNYFDILKTNAKTGYNFNISNENYIFTIDVSDSQNKRISYTTIDIENRVIDYQGYMGDAFNTAPDTDYSTYSIYMDVRYDESHIIPYDQRVKKDSFKYIDYDIYKKDDKVYFPLSLLTARFVKETDVNYLFDDKLMYFYDEDNQIKTMFFADEPIGGMVEDNLYDWVGKTFKGSSGDVLMPVEMARAIRNAFYYAMDNYYGIRTTRKIESYAKLYENYKWSEKFISPKGEDRGEAYGNAINMLDDQHTALGLTGLGLSVWGERDGFSKATPSKLKQERNALQASLTAQRLKAFGLDEKANLRTFEKYSADGKTAYVYLNEFAHVADAAKKEDGKIVSRKTEEELAVNESYYHLLHRIKQIEAKGGVENIVVDMSTNGGGTLGVLCKIASLFAKTNGFETYTMNDKTGDIDTTKTYIDTNYDGKYDETDVYGNKFNFFLLTSPCSFSCGNALPFFCGIAGTAKVIGQKSGGGECSTTTSQFGWLKGFTHSSNTHITTFKTEKVGGQEVKTQLFAEGGAEPSGFYEFGYEHFYDFQYIADLIKENQTNGN